ncbi:MAG: hypothetical protein J7502_14205, partial [Flavisolibacter sp.]|nr:hypothetical protein [Flavisolibacter sp.]
MRRLLATMSVLTITSIYCNFLFAQKNAITPLEKMVEKFKNIKSLQYEESSVTKTLFSNDTAKLHFSKLLFFDTAGHIREADESINTDTYSGRAVFSNKNLYNLASDKSYTVRKEENYLGPIGDLFNNGGVIAINKKHIFRYPQRISKLNDTLVDGRKCYYYTITDLDTIINGNRHFSCTYIAIDKKSYLPVASSYSGYGAIEKGGMKVGSFNLFGKSKYDNVRLNTAKNDLIKFKVPEAYHLHENLPLLAEGTMAPEWVGTAVSENTYSSKSFNGKVLLLFLSDIGCPANQLSVPMLN